MLTCKFFFDKISSISFSEDYQRHHKYSPSALVCLFDRGSLDIVAVALNEPLALSLDFVKDKHLWQILDSRDGFLLLGHCYCDDFLVCNPLTKMCVNVPPPPGLPPLYSLLAAGLIPEGNSSWSIISLYGCTVKSVSRKNERCWVGYFGASKKSWEGKHQEVSFCLPVSRMGVKHPSTVTTGYWNILVFNMYILSVDISTLRLISRKLPFERDVLHIHPHVLGRNRLGQLCLVMHDGTDLLVMCYADSAEAEEFRRYCGFAYNMDSSFAEQNCLLLSDGLVCFDIESGNVMLPFMINLEQRVENVVPYEMAWPPKPRLQPGLQNPEGHLVMEEGAAVLHPAAMEFDAAGGTREKAQDDGSTAAGAEP